MELFARCFTAKIYRNKLSYINLSIFNIYYLYGTVEGNYDPRFLLYTSKDMKSWKIPAEVKDGYALRKGESFCDKQFLARSSEKKH